MQSYPVYFLLLAVASAPLSAFARVAVDLYYEALCPYCQQFITKQVIPLAKSVLNDQVDLRFFPYGNARTIEEDGAIECQHGETECMLNRLHSCAIQYQPRMKLLEYINCTETTPNMYEECGADILGEAGAKQVNDCYTGDLGKKLDKDMQKASDDANYQYVPWVVLDGEHDPRAQMELSRAVCARLTDKPPLCTELLARRRLDSKYADFRVCFKEE